MAICHREQSREKRSILRNFFKSKARRAPVKRARKNCRFSVGPTIPVQTPHDHEDDPLAELYDDEPLACDDMPHEFDSDVEERYTGNGRL